MKKKSEKITEKQAEELLKKYAPDLKTYQKILQHSQAVKRVALTFAQAIQKQGHKVDLNLIKTGSLLHDLGRFTCPPKTKDSLKHGFLGGKILRKEGLPQHARIAETHLGAGISKEEIIQQKLPLPKRNFLPRTIEEKIIAYVDNLVFGDRLGTVQEVVERFKKEIPSALPRLIKLHNEIEKLRGGLQFL